MSVKGIGKLKIEGKKNEEKNSSTERYNETGSQLQFRFIAETAEKRCYMVTLMSYGGKAKIVTVCDILHRKNYIV